MNLGPAVLMCRGAAPLPPRGECCLAYITAAREVNGFERLRGHVSRECEPAYRSYSIRALPARQCNGERSPPLFMLFLRLLFSFADAVCLFVATPQAHTANTAPWFVPGADYRAQTSAPVARASYGPVPVPVNRATSTIVPPRAQMTLHPCLLLALVAGAAGHGAMVFPAPRQ